MIIHRINSKNILAFEELVLADLPEQGIIAISGETQTGKSAIGEIICFALFGQVSSFNSQQLHKIIHWEKNECSVTIRFSNDKTNKPDGEVYAITRTLDVNGYQTAQLYKAYYKENILAEGVEQVEKTLFELTSLHYEEFRMSYFITHVPSSTPSQISHALKSIAGITTMEHYIRDLEQEIEQDTIDLDDRRKQLIPMNEELSNLPENDDQLDAMKVDYASACQGRDSAEGALASYLSCANNYKETLTKYGLNCAKKKWLLFWLFVFFILSLGAFSLSWIVVYRPDSVDWLKINTYLPSFFPDFLSRYSSYMLYGFASTALLLLTTWFIKNSKKSSTEISHTAGEILANKMRELDKYRQIRVNKARSSLIKKISTCHVSNKELSKCLKTDLNFLTIEKENQSLKVAELSSALAMERKRIQRANDIKVEIGAIETHITKNETHHKINEMALDLLMGACQQLSARFNKIIHHHINKILPLITKNNYESLQIDNELCVQLVSNKRQNRIDLDDLPTAIQQQILLAIHLAFSQQTTNKSKANSRQFVILDNVFSFNDKQQQIQLLTILPTLSKELSQFWVMSDIFPQEIEFDYTIHCE